MAKQTIDVGTPNDDTGTPLRDAFIMVNENFDEIYAGPVIRTAPALPIGIAGDLAGMIAYDADYLYMCVTDFDNVAAIWKRVAIPAPASPSTW